MRSRQSLLCILAAVVVVITAAGSNAIELVGRATMVQADSIPMGLPGDTVWNFSGVRPLPGSKTWVASKMGDSVLAVACGDSQLTYLERNDSLYWLGFENPSTEMRETGTVRAARPSRMPYSHSHMTPIRFMGRFCGIDSVMLRGVLQSECDAHGAIVLGNDTVADVTRERQQMSAEFSAGGISKGKVSIVRHRWYRAGGYFPVAESLEAEIQAGNKVLSHHKSCYVVDTLSEACSNRGRARAAASPLGARAAIEQIDVSGDRITVKPDFKCEAAGGRFEICVVDLLGRVYGSATGDVGPKVEPVEIYVGRLPCGRYLLRIDTGKSQESKMFTVK
ncbi:MAG: hypothetical protein SPL48_08930 [Bacteroidales bacterium]|nr:hypothetical protein [Bacteroidales bacterium]